MRKFTTVLMVFLLSAVQLFAQNRTVTGKVTDEKGAAVAGASVTIDNTSKGVVTGTDGSFTISVPANAKQLTVRSSGLETQKITITSSNTLNVKMTSDSKSGSIDEVVVQVPYGTVKKTSFTGAEGTVTAKMIEKQQAVSFTKALDGVVSGVSTTNGGGAPGSNADIRVRGIGSISSSSDVLYVLNGVAYDGSISALNPDDIETITILKDAASTALYGARGSNGVIMITTKKGKKGRANISVKATQGFINRGIPEYDRLAPKEYYEMMWEATKNNFLFSGALNPNTGLPWTDVEARQASTEQLTDGSHLVYNAYNVAGDKLVNPTTGKLNTNAKLLWNESWAKALFRIAQRQNVNMSISGASDKTDYLISAGYLNEEGTMINSGYKRYNMRLNVNTEANDWLRTGLNIDGSMTKNTNVTNGGTATSNPFYYSQQMGPIYPIYQHNTTTGETILDANGNPVLDWGVPSQMGARPYAANSNLLGTLALDDRNSNNFNANANTYLDIKISKHFSLKTTLGLNSYNSYGTTYQNNQFGDAQNVKGRSTKSQYRQISYTLNEVLSWNQSFGNHNFSALVGHENYHLQVDQMSATSTGFAFPGTSQLNAATTLEGNSSQLDNLKIESFFGRLQYDYNGKYILSASLRQDGNSRFAPDVRKGKFWSVGAGWRVSEENFMKKVKWVNELKLKADYGNLGNEDIGRYYAYQTYYLGGYPNAGFSGYIADVVGANPKLSWESPYGSNFGVDFVLFKRRLQGSVDYFQRGSDGMILNVPQPPSTAITSTPDNVARMINKGIEITLGYNVIMKKNFDWRIDVNFTAYKNEIQKIPSQFKNEQIISGVNNYKAGHSIYDFYMREFAGVDVGTGDALYYRDILDASGKATGQRTVTNDWTKADRYFFEGSLPKWSGGITNTIRFKNYELSIITSYSKGGKFYDGNYQGIMHGGSYGTAWHTDILNSWKKPGDVTNVPRVQNGNDINIGTSSRYLFDRSYINIRNITLTYNLPKATANKLHINGMSVFGNIDNVALFAVKKGMDPQRNFSGTADATYPPVRTVTFGVNFSL